MKHKLSLHNYKKLLELDDQKEIEDPRLKVLENKEVKEKPEVKEKNG